MLAGPQRGLALCLLALGKPLDAEQVVRAAALVATAPAEAAVTRNTLARILIASSDFEEAETAALDAERTLRTAGAVDTIGYAEVLSTLAVVTRNRGRLADALRYSSEAAALMEKFAGPAKPSTAAAWNNLAQVLVSLGRYSEAKPLFERAIICWEHVSNPSHPDVASGLTQSCQPTSTSETLPGRRTFVPEGACHQRANLRNE